MKLKVELEAYEGGQVLIMWSGMYSVVKDLRGNISFFLLEHIRVNVRLFSFILCCSRVTVFLFFSFTSFSYNDCVQSLLALHALYELET